MVSLSHMLIMFMRIFVAFVWGILGLSVFDPVCVFSFSEEFGGGVQWGGKVIMVATRRRRRRSRCTSEGRLWRHPGLSLSCLRPAAPSPTLSIINHSPFIYNFFAFLWNLFLNRLFRVERLGKLVYSALHYVMLDLVALELCIKMGLMLICFGTLPSKFWHLKVVELGSILRMHQMP